MKQLLLILLCLPLLTLAQGYSNTPRSRGYGELAAVIVLCVVVPFLIYLFRVIKAKLLYINSRNSAIRKLKEQLSNIDRQISSFKEIDSTGDITKEEKKEWLELTRKHKEINDKIVSLRHYINNGEVKFDDNPTETFLLKLWPKGYHKTTVYDRKKGESIEDFRDRLNQ